MDLYGFAGNLEVGPLLEVTISANPKELRALSTFLLQCANEMEHDPTGWEHEHFPDNESLVVFNPSKI